MVNSATESNGSFKPQPDGTEWLNGRPEYHGIQRPTLRYNGTVGSTMMPIESNHSSSANGGNEGFLSRVTSSSTTLGGSNMAIASPRVAVASTWQNTSAVRSAGIQPNAHLIQPFNQNTPGAAAAVNLGSLSYPAGNAGVGVATDHKLSTHSPGLSSAIPIQNIYNGGTSFSMATVGNMSKQSASANLPGTLTDTGLLTSSIPSLNTNNDNRLMMLQRDLEQERTMRAQLQQRVIELNQKMHAQQLIEKSYEELMMKYKHAIAQMQQMNMMIERYKSVMGQLEQDKRLLVNENTSLKAQENVAHDKTMMYNILMERSKKLEEENSSLVLENETYQRQYEKSIDEISKQVVQALLTQKALQEQCLQLQERLGDLERENMEYSEAVRQARQASSDSRLVWSYRPGRSRAQTASPSADSVRSMPAQHLYWRQGSVASLEHQQTPANGSHHEPLMNSDAIPENRAPSGSRLSNEALPLQEAVCIETEFPANNGSPKSTRRDLDRHPSSGSLDAAYHSRGFIRHNGRDVNCQRSVSAEALRDVKVNMRRSDLALPAHLVSTSSSNGSRQQVQASVHKEPSVASEMPGKESNASNHSMMTDSGVVNDPFAEDADDILSKHQSLIVGSTEDIFSAIAADLKNDVIHEEDSLAESYGNMPRSKDAPPAPPPRPRSRCHSDCSLAADSTLSPHKQRLSVKVDEDKATENGPPPLPPKQYKGSRRPYKPLPAEPIETDYGDDELDSSDKNTDSESIKQEINALTSKIAHMASSHRH